MSGRRILVSESDPRVAALLREALEAKGYAVDARLDVLASADQRRHGLIILNSAGAVERLRALGCRIPILFLSDSPLAADEVRKLDGVGILPKPFDLEELRWEVALALEED